MTPSNTGPKKNHHYQNCIFEKKTSHLMFLFKNVQNTSSKLETFLQYRDNYLKFNKIYLCMEKTFALIFAQILNFFLIGIE